MRHKTKKSGFSLLETILTIGLLSTVAFFKLQHLENAKLENIAYKFGEDGVEILKAIDKRILLDGYSNNGDWDKVWNGRSEVLSTMIKEELNSSTNPDCGVAGSGWSPKVATNAGISLFDCNQISHKKTPFNFNAHAKRKGNNANKLIEYWYLEFYSDNEKEFMENFNIFPTIIDGGVNRSILQMTGTYDVYLSDRTDPQRKPLQSTARCWDIKTNCSIVFKYTKAEPASSMTDRHLSISGKSALAANLNFRTFAKQPLKCSKTGGESINCGFNISGKDLDLFVNSTRTETLQLITDQNGVAVPLVCTTVDGHSDICGMTTIDNGSSYAMIATLNKTVASKIQSEVVESSNEILVRNGLGANNSVLGLSHENVTHYSTYPSGNKRSISLTNNGIDFVAPNGLLDMTAKGVDFNLSEIHQLNSSKIKNELTNGQINFKSNSLRVKSNSFTSEVATVTDALSGVQILGFSVVSPNRRVPALKCPKPDKGNIPVIRGFAIPVTGITTSDPRVGSICSTKGDDFLDIWVEDPVLNKAGLNNWTVSYRAQVKVRCDPNRDSAAQYRTIHDEATKEFYIQYRLWGGSASTLVDDGNKFALVQYCDYR